MGFIFLQEFELNNLTVEFHKLLNYNLKIKLNKLKFKDNPKSKPIYYNIKR